MPSDLPSTRNSALTFGRGTLLSRVLGFIRDMAIAALVGADWVADALLLAFRLPFLGRSLLAEGAFAYALVPAYQESRNVDDSRAWTFIRSATLVLFIFLGVLALLGFVFSDQLAGLLAPGFSDMPNLLAMTSRFLGLSLISLPLVAGAAVCAAALIAERRFRRPAYATAVFNAVIIAFAAVAFLLYGTEDEHTPYMLCAGVIAAGAVQWVYQAAPLVSLGFSWSGPVDFKDAALRRSLRALPGSIFGIGGHYLNIFIATVLASFLAEGSISALYYAERLIGFPLGVVGATMGLAALSDLSRLVRTDESGKRAIAAEFPLRLAKAVRVTLFFALPATVGTACLALPLTSVIFGRGEFDQAALLTTSSVLLAFTVGLPALAAARPLLAGLGALGDFNAAKRGALWGVAATALLGAGLLVFDAPWGMALAVSLAAWVNAAILIRALGRFAVFPSPGGVWVLKVLTACAFMAACVLWMAGLFDSHAAKAATVPLGVVAYFVAAFVLRLEEASLVMPAVNWLLHRK
ncbi:murein biosynthesis integral membrane protein MurJ [Desulfovibrio sp. OttesenSCG-928-O18]|nr:murein biosynthesis integral membrane protein MurJ [Desulfovibrio sp. OttesenSCG-928-O18]